MNDDELIPGVDGGDGEEDLDENGVPKTKPADDTDPDEDEDAM